MEEIQGCKMKCSIYAIIIFHFSFSLINGQITPSQFGVFHPPPPDGLVPERASISAIKSNKITQEQQMVFIGYQTIILIAEHHLKFMLI